MELQCCVNFLLYSRVTQLYTYSFSHSFPSPFIPGCWLYLPVLYSQALLSGQLLFKCHGHSVVWHQVSTPSKVFSLHFPCWLSLPVCAFPTSAPAHQAPCGLSSPARFPWPGAISLLPDLPERTPLSQHTVRVVVQSFSAPVCILLFHLYSRESQSHQSPTVLSFLAEGLCCHILQLIWNLKINHHPGETHHWGLKNFQMLYCFSLRPL